MSHQIKVDQITRGRIAEQIEIQDRRQRIHLFTHSRFENERKTFAGIGKIDLSALKAGTGDGQGQAAQNKDSVEEVLSVRMPDGTRLELPRLSDEQYASIDAVLASATPEQADYLVRTGQAFGAAAYKEIDEDRAEGPYSLGATRAAQMTQDAYLATTGQQSREEAVTGAVLFGMYGVETNLKEHFYRVQQEQRLQSEIRTDAAELEEALADWPDDGSTELFNYTDVTFNPDGTLTVTEHKNVELTKSEAQALLQKLNGLADSLGSMHNSDMYELQVKVHKYQQALNTLSNIMKQMDDTHKAIIGNARA